MGHDVNSDQQVDKLGKEINYYLNRCRADRLSPVSIRTYQVGLDCFHWWCASVLGELDPQNFDEDSINQYVAYLKTPQKKRWGERGRPGKETLSMASVGTYFRCVRVLFNYLEAKKKISRSPIPRNYKITTKKDPIPTKYLKALEKEQVSKIIDFLTSKEELAKYNGVRNLAMFTLMLESGMRRGELLSIKVGDFDWDRSRVEIRGKTGPRTCFFSPHAERVLTDYLEKYRKRQEEYNAPTSPFWLTSDTHPLTTSGFESLMARMTANTGVKFSAHKLRHTFATVMVQRASIYEVSKLLGHSSVHITEIYTHASPERLQQTYENNSPLSVWDVDQMRVMQPRRGRPRGSRNIKKD